MFWQQRELCGFDVETTGVDPEHDRIVTAAVVTDGGGRPAGARTWISDVDGVEIPAGATAVHGYTTAAARASGRPAAEVVSEIIEELVLLVERGLPLVVMNAPFDLTMLDAEAARHGLVGLFDRCTPLVVDPMVLDKHVDRYRSGSRRLEALAVQYGVPLDAAHDATADAFAACQVARAVLEGHAELAPADLGVLHEQQCRWAVEQQEGLRAYFARSGSTDRARTVRVGWPRIPAMRPEVRQP